MNFESDETMQALMRQTRRTEILGIKTEAQATAPVFYVAEYLASAGYDIVPVPVYYPEARTIFGWTVHRRLTEIPGAVDMVAVFRRPVDPLILMSCLRSSARYGNSSAFATTKRRPLRAAGITVVCRTAA